MTSPGGTNVGTAYGRVRIDYESSGVGRAVKDVESLQDSMVTAGKTAGQTAKAISKSQGVISQAVASATATLEKGLNVSAPVTVSASKVEMDLGSINKAIASYKDAKRQAITVNTKVNIKATDVDIDRGAITAAIESLSRDGTIGQKIKIRAPVEVETSDVTINTAGIANALSGTGTDAITLRAPITIDPSSVTISEGALSQISAQVRQASSDGVAEGNSGGRGRGGGSGGGGGMMAGGALSLAARAAGPLLAAAGPAVVLGKGFQRLQGLDEAAIKLKALGKSTEEIKNISNSALKSVEGTAFGLDEAFQTAATAINSGIKPGKQLDDYLKATASTAALAGISMSDLGDQFSEASVQGKLTGDILQSLYARNVPVLQLLADEYGVTQQAAQAMVSNSEVSFDRFIHAMGQNGDAATIMSNTVGGSFDNLMASVSRIGAMLLAPLFGKATGEASTMADVIQSLTDQLKKFEGVLRDNATTMISFWELAGKGALLFGQGVVNVLGWVLEGIGGIMRGISWLSNTFGDMAEAFGMEDVSKGLKTAGRNLDQYGGKVFEAGQTVHSFDDTLDAGWEGLKNWADGAREAASGTGTLSAAAAAGAVPMISLNEALEKFGLKADDVSESLTGTNQEFLKLMDTLEKKDAPKALTDALQKMRDSFVNGGRAAESYETALENMSDTTLEASDRAGALIDSLKDLGILPGGDELASYNEQFEKMTSYARDLPDMLGALGGALKNADGSINSSEGNGRKLLGVIEEARKNLYSLAASGEVPADEAFKRTTDGLRLVLQDYGLQGKEAEDLINKYLTGGKGQAFFEAQFTGKKPKDVVEEAFAGDPAKIQSILKLMTTQDDILNELLGGPNSTLKIPAIIDVAPGSPGAKDNSINADGTKRIPGEPSRPGAPAAPTAPIAPIVPDVWYRMPDGKIGKAKLNELPPGAAQLKYDPTKANFTGGNQLTDRPSDNVPRDRHGNGLDITGNELPDLRFAPVQMTPELTNVLDDPAMLNNLTSKETDPNNAAAQKYTQIIADARASGQSVSEAFAQGITSQEADVREAIIRLAQLVGDGLGNSPAKYGPLAGQGYSLYRGKKVTTAFAEGIESEAGKAQAATASMTGSASQPFGAQIEMLMKDLTDLSSFGKLALDFGKQLGDIAFSGAKLANDLSGGRLFPKSYEVDKGKMSGGSALGNWNPTRNATPGAPFSTGAAGSATPGQIPLKQNADGTWTSTDPEWAKLIARESGGNPTVQNNEDSNAQKGTPSQGLFQIIQPTWASNGGTQFAPDAKSATPQQQAQIAAKIFAEQGGSPWGAVPGGDREDESLLRAGLMGGSSPANVPMGESPYASSASSDRGGVDPSRFLVHTSESDMGPKELADWMESQGDRSYNYIVDKMGQSILDVVDPAKAAWSVGAKGNQSSINGVIAGSHADWTTEEWMQNASGGIDALAKIAARDTAAFGIPQSMLANGDPNAAGIGGHDWVAKTLGGTDHTDPGAGFPWQYFMDQVKGNLSSPTGSERTTPLVSNQGASGPLMGSVNSPAMDLKAFDDALLSNVPKGSYDNDTKDLSRGLADCSSSVEDLVNMMDGMPTAGGSLTTMNAADELVKRGFLPTDTVVPGAFNVGYNSGHMQATLPGGTNFNWGSDSAAALGGRTSQGANDPELTSRYYRPVAGMPAQGNLGTPQNPLSVEQQNQPGSPYLPPGLSEFSDTLGSTPKSKDDAITWLQSIDGQISDQNRLGTPEALAKADALGAQRSKTMGQFGLKEGPSGLDKAQGVVDGVAGLASGFFETFDAGIKYIGALKTTTEVLTRGIANTGDVMTLIDQFQIGLDFFNKVVQNASDVASFAGQFTGGMDMGGTSAIGGALGMISQIMTAVNTGIDLAQEGYKLVTKYVGRFITSWAGMPGATDMKYLLDEVTGQVKAYSSDNPEMKTTFNTLGRSLGKDYAERPTPTNNFTIYQGPGQDPRDTMDDAMFTVRSSGVGAFGYAQ